MISIKNDKKSPIYPKLKRHISGKGELIVLFCSERKGTVVHTANNCDQVGDYRTDWITSTFQDYDGNITLSNTK